MPLEARVCALPEVEDIPGDGDLHRLAVVPRALDAGAVAVAPALLHVVAPLVVEWDDRAAVRVEGSPSEYRLAHVNETDLGQAYPDRAQFDLCQRSLY